MVVLVHAEQDMLDPEEGDDSRSVDRPWLAPRRAEHEQRPNSPPLGVALWEAEAAARPSVGRTDGTPAFAAATASWRKAHLLFTHSVRAFNAAHRRQRRLKSQAATVEMPPPHHERAAVTGPPPVVLPTLTIPDEPTGPTPLTRRQREVAALIARGYSDKQIADALVMTPGTASNHVGHILRRLGCRSRAQVAAWAVQNGLLATDRS